MLIFQGPGSEHESQIVGNFSLLTHSKIQFPSAPFRLVYF